MSVESKPKVRKVAWVVLGAVVATVVLLFCCVGWERMCYRQAFWATRVEHKNLQHYWLTTTDDHTLPGEVNG